MHWDPSGRLSHRALISAPGLVRSIKDTCGLTTVARTPDNT